MADDDLDRAPEPDVLPPGELAAYDDRLRKSDRALYEAALFWRRVLRDPVGRREIWAILDNGKALQPRPTFACGPNGTPQPEATWHELGVQNFAFNLYLSLKRMDPHGTLRMELEHNPAMAPPTRARRRKKV